MEVGEGADAVPDSEADSEAESAETTQLPGGKFDGLAFGDFSNQATDGTRVPAHPYTGSTDYIVGRPEPDLVRNTRT